MEAGTNTNTMRNRLFIFLLLSVLTATGEQVIAQKIRPAKDLNTIIAWSPGGKHGNFIKAIDACITEGYGIQYSDSAMGIISTLPKESIGVVVQLNIACSDTAISFRGQMISSLSIELYGVRSEGSNYELTSRGQKGSAFYKAWQTMDRAARIISDSIIYVKR